MFDRNRRESDYQQLHQWDRVCTCSKLKSEKKKDTNKFIDDMAIVVDQIGKPKALLIPISTKMKHTLQVHCARQ